FTCVLFNVNTCCCFLLFIKFFFFSSRRRHTRSKRDWSSDVCSSDLPFHLDSRGLLPQKLHSQHQNRNVESWKCQNLIPQMQTHRSEERRVGKESRSKFSPKQLKNKDGETVADRTCM